MFFQFSPTRQQKKLKLPPKENESEKLETLSLSPFTSLPKLFFDSVKLGQTAIRKLLIKNTTPQEVTLFVTNNIPQEINASFNWNQITIKIDEEALFVITWNPLSVVSVRYIITFEDFKKIRRDVPVAFKSVGNKKPEVGVKSKSQKSKQLSKKSPTKKYYTTKPPNISPNKFSPSHKKVPSLLKKINKKSPTKKHTKISSLPEISVYACAKSPESNTFNKDKENVPQTFVCNSFTESLFVSPKNAPFLLENSPPLRNSTPSERRETYVLKTKTPHIPLVDYGAGRETCINGIIDSISFTSQSRYLPKISPATNFDDSLENSPKLSHLTSNKIYKNKISKQRTPLKLSDEENIMSETAYKSPHEANFEYKLLHDSFCFSPVTAPYKERNTFVPPLSTIEITKLVDIQDVPKSFYLFPKNEDSELACDFNSGTFLKYNSSIKENCSFETYVKSNISGTTYTKESSVGNVDLLGLSPSSSKISISPQHPSIHLNGSLSERAEISLQYLSSSENNCHVSDWFTKTIEQKRLSCIQEESNINNTRENESIIKTRQLSSLKRKSDTSFPAFEPKRSNLLSGPNNWSRRGGTAIRVAKHSTGLNLKQFANKKKDNQEQELVAEVTKTDTHKIIVKDPFLLAATNMLDPFMTPGLYVNQEWIEQQEIYFKKWLNALLTPPKDLSAEEQVVDVARVWQECKKREIEDAPTKELISNEYHTSTRLNNLRKAAQDLFRSSEMAAVLSKVCLAVDQGKLSIREDKDFHLNLSVKSEIISMLLSYNSLWLRIGLETIYNEIIPLNSNSDIVGLSAFIVNRLLKNPYLIRKYKSIHNPKYTPNFNKFFLKKFFALVYFLDQAKNKKLIPHDPCLFCKKGIVKESKELLLMLAREILLAIGDVTKVLKFLGYVVTHIQTYIHEFDYAVKHLGVDLRDGIRLTKILELILLKDNLSLSLRVPPISRLQKIHNMKIVFASLEQAGYKILYDISPKDIVDGHREKTLSFLWQIIYKFEAPLMVKSSKTIQAWFRSLPVVLKRRKLGRDRLNRDEAARKIQNWYKRQKFLQNLTRFTKSLLKYLEMKMIERAAVKIQAFYRMYYCRKIYQTLIQTITLIQARGKGWLVRNVYKKQIRSALVIQSYVRMFLHRKRFLKIKQSVIIIQNRYRSKKKMELARNRYLKLKLATILVQRKWRANKRCIQYRQQYQFLKRAALVVQRRWRAQKRMKAEHKRYMMLRTATIVLQRSFRATVLYRQARAEFLRIKHASIIIQRKWRAFVLYRQDSKAFIELKNATLFIQRRWRALKLAIQVQSEYEVLKTATLVIQKRWRAVLCCREIKKLKATVAIQRRWRGKKMTAMERKKFLDLRNAVICVQKRWRAKKLGTQVKNEYEMLKTATLVVQSRWRAVICGREFKKQYEELKQATIAIQTRWRNNKMTAIEQKKFIDLRNAVICVQTRWRAKKLGVRVKHEYETLRTATLVIQSRWRAIICGREVKKQFENLKRATVTIQKRWQGKKITAKERKKFVELRNAVICIQRRWRAKKLCTQVKNDYEVFKTAVLVIQSRWRALICGREYKKQFENLKQAAITIQTRWRSKKITAIEQKKFVELRNAVICVQTRWRAKQIAVQVKSEYEVLKRATLVVQSRWRAVLCGRKVRKQFEIVKQTTITIQIRWRAKKIAAIKRKKFIKLRNAVIYVQRKWRALRLSKVTRTNYIALKNVTIHLQQKWKAKRLMRTDRERYLILNRSSIFIQRRFRANKLMKIHHTHYIKIRTSAITIQRYYRGYVQMKKDRQRFLQLKAVVLNLQKRIRGYLIRQKYAYYFTEEAREMRNLEKQRKVAATKLQAAWRGYKCREQAHSSFEKIRRSLKKAMENAEPENTLGSRSKTALQVFISERSTLFVVIKALEELDMATRHSKEICIVMSKLLPEQLYLMLSALTRSLPEMKAAISSVNILITFCKYPPTRNYSFIPNYIDSLLTLMLHWCDKETMLFPTTCTLLWLFAHTPDWKQCILNLPNFNQRFEKIRDLVTRKQNMVKRMGIKGVSVFFFYKNINLPSLYNDWGLINDSRPNVFTNSVQALLALSKILHV